MISLLDRLIWAEIASSFGLGWGILCVLLVMNHLLYLARLAVERGVEVETAAILLLDKVPWLVVHTIPAGVLLGTMLGLSRLVDRNEITALRVCGVSIYRLAVPAVLAGTAATVGALALAETVGSAGQHRYYRTLDAILRQTVPHPRSGHPFLTVPTRGSITFLHAEQESPAHTLSDVTTVSFVPGTPLKLIQSSAARYDPSGRWLFSHGHMYVVEPTRPFAAEFEALTVHTAAGPSTEAAVPPDESSLRELAGTARTLERRRLDPWLYVEEFHFRLAEAAGSIAFALVAVPLSVQGSNKGSTASVGLSIVVLIVYYLLHIPARLACDGRMLHPVPAAWLPDILVATMGAWLIFRLGRRGRETPPVGDLSAADYRRAPPGSAADV